MNALALRHGVDACETALNAVKFNASQQRVGIVKKVKPTTLSTLSIQDPCLWIDGSLLMRWCLATESLPEKFNLYVRGDPFGDDEYSKEYKLFFGRWQELKKYSSFIASLCPMSSSSGFQRVQSRLHTLHLDEVDEDTFEYIFEDKRVIALFEKVIIRGVFFDCDSIKKLVVDEGVISSLKIDIYELDDEESIQLADMLKVNRLETFDLHAIPTSQSFAHALVYSLNQHVQTFADRSILRDLDLQDTFGGLNPKVNNALFQDVLKVIGILPNLISFGIHEPSDPNLLQVLAGAIGNWKIRHFKLWRYTRDGFLREQHYVNLSHLFNSIERSMHLKEFSICVHGLEILEEVWTSHIFELALSTRSGLLEMELPGYTIHPLLVSTLVAGDCDRAIALKRHLRRFFVLWDNSLFSFENMDDEDIFDYVRSLLWLVSNHLPYLYDVGTNLFGGVYLEDLIRVKQDSELLQIWKNLLAQLELNRVGMALLQSEVLPTVPGGLWSRVLHRAIVCEENEAQLPWTGIYTMVRALVEDGHIGWGESRADATKDRSPSTKKRPRP